MSTPAKPAAHTAAESPDAELAARVLAGDHHALRVLMRRHNQLLFRTARAILKNDAEAEDAVQESWLHAYRALAGFRADAKLPTWLVRIVVNESLGRLRAAGSRHAEVVLLDAAADSTAIDAEVSMQLPESGRPDHIAARGEMRRLLEARIDALPEAFRAVFVLRAVQEMNVDEVSECLNLPPATVRTRYFRARAMLRASLEREIDLATGDAFSFAGARCDRIAERVLARLARQP